MHKRRAASPAMSRRPVCQRLDMWCNGPTRPRRIAFFSRLPYQGTTLEESNMSTYDVLKRSYKFNRDRTLALLDEIEKEPDPQAALAWRPAEGRAHIAWQLMHIAVTEEIFATERLAPEKDSAFEELWPRFRGGSTPDDDVPTLATIRQTFDEARAHLFATLDGFPDDRLKEIPEALKERGLTMLDVLHIISWHEAHHQGQAHAVFNLYRASRA